ncbi:hypothetical protein PTKU64_03240 [Paraburkholderia terrae]|uniref:Uncharacterized protein n=1 Tax=Paraburkholderia terrae TaxID=311230 RepID=A0ABN6J945_9BURK|nr:hypothetical protein PTKU64_03240 [Paraburkholderia terrae]
MRSAKIAASDTVARNSGALMRVEVADGLDIGNDYWMTDSGSRDSTHARHMRNLQRWPSL